MQSAPHSYINICIQYFCMFYVYVHTPVTCNSLHAIKKKKKREATDFLQKQGGRKSGTKTEKRQLKKPLPDLVLTLLHIYYLLSEVDFVAHPTSAHRIKDFTANFTPLSNKGL